MSAGHTPLGRPFRYDSKHPTEFSTGSHSCSRCDDGTMAYDPEIGTSRCRSCNASLRSNEVSNT